MPDPTSEPSQGAHFSAATIERYRKVRTLAENKGATDGERSSARRRLSEMESKYPALKAAVEIKDEVERRKHAPPPPHTRAGHADAWSGDVPPWTPRPGGPQGFPGYRGPGGFRPGHGPNPFEGVPRASDAVPPVDQGETLWERAKRRAQARAAGFVDDLIDNAKRQWDEMAEEEVRRERGQPPPPRARRARTRTPAQDGLHGRADEAVREARERLHNPARAAQQRARRDYYDMAKLEDLLDDPMVTEAGVAFEIDPDTNEPCFRFDVSIPNRVWRRLKRNPKLFMRWLEDLKADGEEELAAEERRKREGGGYDDPEGPEDDDDGEDEDSEDEETPDTEERARRKR